MNSFCDITGRFKIRCELYDTERLSSIIRHNSRLLLEEYAARYLFDNGYNAVFSGQIPAESGTNSVISSTITFLGNDTQEELIRELSFFYRKCTVKMKRENIQEAVVFIFKPEDVLIQCPKKFTDSEKIYIVPVSYRAFGSNSKTLSFSADDILKIV